MIVPEVVLSAMGRSAVPVLLIPPAESELPSATQFAPSNFATRMSLAEPENSVHATIGFPSAPRVMFGRREDESELLMPPSDAEPFSCCQLLATVYFAM